MARADAGKDAAAAGRRTTPPIVPAEAAADSPASLASFSPVRRMTAFQTPAATVGRADSDDEDARGAPRSPASPAGSRRLAAPSDADPAETSGVVRAVLAHLGAENHEHGEKGENIRGRRRVRGKRHDRSFVRGARAVAAQTRGETRGCRRVYDVAPQGGRVASQTCRGFSGRRRRSGARPPPSALWGARRPPSAPRPRSARVRALARARRRRLARQNRRAGSTSERPPRPPLRRRRRNPTRTRRRRRKPTRRTKNPYPRRQAGSPPRSWPRRTPGTPRRRRRWRRS